MRETRGKEENGREVSKTRREGQEKTRKRNRGLRAQKERNMHGRLKNREKEIKTGASFDIPAFAYRERLSISCCIPTEMHHININKER